MAATTEAITYDIDDLKVYALTDDTGASPTYGTAVDVYGVADLSLDPNLVSAELKGDARIIAKRSKVDRFPWTATYARLSQDVLDVVLGGDKDTLGANKRWRFTVGSAGAKLGYFGMAAAIHDVDNGNGSLHVYAYKSMVTGGNLLRAASEAFSQPTLQADAIGLDCAAGPWAGVTVDLVYFAVRTDLPATLVG